MGYLDHSTNNIIVDAVLTDRGRALLSANDGSFRISQFALSDEEVDYGIISKFGRNVGQEKIEKNTPVLEAPTRSNLGQKYRLVSIANTYMTHLPNLTVTSITGGSSSSVATSTVTLKKGVAGQNTANILMTVEPTVGEAIDEDLVDEFYFVEVNNIFLNIPQSDIDIINIDNTVVYRVGTQTDQVTNNNILSFNVGCKGFSTSQFNTYKIATASSSSDYVKLFVKATGATSGLTKSVEVRIQLV